MNISKSSIVIYNNNQNPLVLERRKKENEPFFEDNWTSYVEKYYFISLNNEEIYIDEEIICIYEANTLLTIYDYVKNNNIDFYKKNINRLRPQMSYNVEKNAKKVLKAFFNDETKYMVCYATSSGGYTSHCAFRINNIIYNAYISLSKGPYNVEIIDKGFINDCIEFNIYNIIN